MPVNAAPIGSDEATYQETNTSTLSCPPNPANDFWKALEVAPQRQYFKDLKHERHLGEGSQFSVDLYHYEPGDSNYANPFLPRAVAVKTAKVTKWNTNGTGNGNDLGPLNNIQNFCHEIRVLYHLPIRENPNIIDIKGAYWLVDLNKPPIPRLIVEYSEIGTLSTYLRSRKSLDMVAKMSLFQNICDGLDTLHRSGIIHGDLKLANILVFSDEESNTVRAKLSDFGCAISRVKPKNEWTYCGTDRYCPPEVDRSQVMALADLERCDNFTMGLCLWEILQNGIAYFKGAMSRGLVAQNPPWPGPLYGQLFERDISNVGSVFQSKISTMVLQARILALGQALLAESPGKRYTAKKTLEVVIQIQTMLNVRHIDTNHAVSNDTRSESASVLAASPLQIWSFVSSRDGLPYEIQETSFNGIKSMCDRLDGEEGAAAYLHLSYLYAHGYGTSSSYSECLQCLHRASKLGSLSAHLLILRIYSAIGNCSDPDFSNSALELMDIESSVPYHIKDLEAKFGQAPAADNFLHRWRHAWKINGEKILADHGMDLVSPKATFTISEPYEYSIIRVVLENSLNPSDCVVELGLERRGVPLVHMLIAEGWIGTLLRILAQYPDMLCHVGQPNWYTGLMLENSDLYLSAAFGGKSEVVRFLRDHGVKPYRRATYESPINKYFNALHMLGQFPAEDMDEMADIFVELGNDPNCMASVSSLATPIQGFGLPITGTPLDFAICMRNITGVKALLRKGADPLLTVQNGYFVGHNALELAVSLHLHDVVYILLQYLSHQGHIFTAELANELLLKISSEVIGGRDLYLKWLLHGEMWREACAKTIQICIDLGAAINHVSMGGWSALTSTAYFHPCQDYILKELLDAGANPNAVGESGGYATSHCINDTVSDKDSSRVVKTLIAHGADVNWTSRKKNNCLAHNAAVLNRPETLRVLQDAGADMTIRDEFDHTPFYLAVASCSVGSTRFFLDRMTKNTVVNFLLPAEDKLFNNLGRLLHCERLFKESNQDGHWIAKELLSIGVPIDVRDEVKQDSRTALAMAVQYGDIEMVTFLLDSGASPYCRRKAEEKYWNYLMEAILQYRVWSAEIARVLFKKLVSATKRHIEQHDLLRSRDFAGRTILHQAISCGQLWAVDILVKSGSSLEHFIGEPWPEFDHLGDFSGLNGLELAYIIQTYTPEQRQFHVGAKVTGIDRVSDEELDAVVNYLEELWPKYGLRVRSLELIRRSKWNAGLIGRLLWSS